MRPIDSSSFSPSRARAFCITDPYDHIFSDCYIRDIGDIPSDGRKDYPPRVYYIDFDISHRDSHSCKEEIIPFQQITLIHPRRGFTEQSYLFVILEEDLFLRKICREVFYP